MYVLEVNAGFVATHHITLGTPFTFISAGTEQQNQGDNRITSPSLPSNGRYRLFAALEFKPA
jgi:hypothetical protein